MQHSRTVRIYYCTSDVRSLMAELPLVGLLEQGAKTLTPDEFDHLRERLLHDRRARIDGQECWFEYETVTADAA